MHNSLFSLLVTFTIILFSACGSINDNDQAGPGVETGNVGGTVIASDGLAKADVNVQLFLAKQSVDSLQSSPEPVLSTTTDAAGNYSFNVTESNIYSVIAESEAEIAFVDSLIISPESNLSQDIALKAPGSLSAKIKLGVELKQPSSVVAYLVGTSYYMNLTDSGTFTFANLPEGTYALVLIPNQENFSSTALSVTITSGIANVIAEPIELKYNGIPIPTNVNVLYDSLSGVVHISWDSVQYEHIQNYIIEKNDASNAVPSWQHISSTNNTYLDDLIFSNSDITKINHADTATKVYEYRISIFNNYGEQGLPYGKTPIAVNSPRKYLPYAHVQDKAILVDSSPLVTLMGSGYSALGEVTPEWDVGNTGVFEPAPGGSLSFLYYNKNIIESTPCIFRVTDTKGLIAQDTTILTVNHSAFLPVANAGDNKSVPSNTLVNLQGVGISLLGNVIKKEWKVGDNDWIEGDSISLTSGSSFSDYETSCLFRVTDSLGITDIDSITVTTDDVLFSFDLPTNNWRQGSGTAALNIVEKDNKGYLMGRDSQNNIALWTSDNLTQWDLLAENLFDSSTSDFHGTVPSHFFTLNNSFFAYDFYPGFFQVWSSEDGISWSDTTTTLPDSILVTSHTLNTNHIVIKNTVYLSIEFLSSLTKVFKSTDGLNWDQIDDIESLGNNNFELFNYHNNICYNSYDVRKCYISNEWLDVILWETESNFAIRDLHKIASNDSVTTVLLSNPNQYPSSQLLYQIGDGPWINIDENALGTSLDYLTNPNYTYASSIGIFKNQVLVTSSKEKYHNADSYKGLIF